MSTGYEDDEFYVRVMRPITRLILLEDQLKRRCSQKKKEQMEKEAVALTKKVQTTTQED
jgi:hypothetical protein